MKVWIVFIFVFTLICVGQAVSSAQEPPITVAHVDLSRYIGLWYEIAKIPNSFQKQCAAGTTAEYSLREDGRIQVVNRCYKEDGSLDEATGIAKIADATSQSKLKVSFVRFLGTNWFWGDYWIIELDSDYQWVIVGHPKRKYGWILSRTPEIPVELRQQLNLKLGEQGYDPEDFENTPVKRNTAESRIP